MRKVDVDLVRPVLAAVQIGGKAYEIRKATVGQILEHTSEAMLTNKALADIRSSDKSDVEKEAEWTIAFYAWKVREVAIFVPEIKESVAKSMTLEQMSTVVDIALSVGGDDSEEGSTKKKKKEALAGEK